MMNDDLDLHIEGPAEMSDATAQNLEANDDGSVTVSLKYPFEVKFKGPTGERTERLESVTLRRLNTADLMILDRIKGDMAQTQALIMRSGSLTRGVSERLDAHDFGQLAEAIKGFFPQSLLGGENS